MRLISKTYLTHTCIFVAGWVLGLNFSAVLDTVPLHFNDDNDHIIVIDKDEPTVQLETGNVPTVGTQQDTVTVGSANIIHENVCGEKANDLVSKEWKMLCQGIPPNEDGTSRYGNLVSDAVDIFQAGKHISIVQIGAHTGFEPNDPIALGMTSLMNALDTHGKSPPKDFFHWSFVEPSPANYRRLVKNISNYTDVCDMKSFNAAVVSDFSPETKKEILFYSVSEDIDPETGVDSRTGKTLPHYITQVSSLSMEALNYNRGQFKRRGLNMDEYVVPTNVAAKRYTDLMDDIHSTKKRDGINADTPLFVMIDTEGFDCEIILGISPDSPYLPKYLLYESKICKLSKKVETENHLRSMEYDVFKIGGDNTMAIRKK